MMLNMKRPNDRVGNQRRRFVHSMACAFTRTDLICVLALVAMLLGLAGFRLTGERGRIARCAGNLQKLGTAMHQFASEHEDGLPAATIVPGGLEWDVRLKPYLRPDLVVANSAYAKRELGEAVAPIYACPSDRIARAKPRSYAMSHCDVVNVGWPVNADSATGLGIWWGQDSIKGVLGDAAWTKAKQDPDSLPKVKLSMISEPANTLLLTELIRHDNTLGNIYWTFAKNAGEQYEKPKADATPFHNGRFNYLMVDGHVEWLTGLQTGGIGGTSGIWTIRKGD
jgi:prepilin-type processing-associated H-X9-DG protein